MSISIFKHICEYEGYPLDTSFEVILDTLQSTCPFEAKVNLSGARARPTLWTPSKKRDVFCAMSSNDAYCFTHVFQDASEMPTTQELRQSLEKGSDEVKIETLRRIIVSTLNGSPQVLELSYQKQLEINSQNINSLNS